MAVEFVLGASVRNIFDASSKSPEHAQMLKEAHEAAMQEQKDKGF